MLRDRTRPPLLLPLVFFAIAMVAAACSEGSEEAALDVATLESDASTVGAAADAATLDEADSGDELTPDEAALDFSQCMRDAGIDFPDLSVDAEGNIELRDAFQTVDRDAEGFQEALDSCRQALEQTGFGGGRGEALESTEVQDALLGFSECVRDAGYDVGDLTLQGRGGAGGGAPTPDDGDSEQGQPVQGQGERQPGFGNREARFAEQLGLDYEDPAVVEIIDACIVIVDEAFTSAGIGQR